MTVITNQEQALLSTLTPAMCGALLSASPAQPEVEWDNPADYCEGHESLRGDRMGVTEHCEGDRVCQQARDAYDRDRIPDPDRLVITVSTDVTIGTVVALIGRSLCYPNVTAMREHELTELGLCVRHTLVALQERGQLDVASRPGYTRRQRERALNAVRAARHAYRFASEANRTPHAFVEAVAAALDSVATQGNTSPETLRAIARAMKDI